MPPEARSVSHYERILLLRRAPAIGTLPAHLLSIIAEATRERFFPKGSVLLREGEPIESIHYLVDGKVRTSFQGRDLGVAPAGAAIGALGVLTRDDQGMDAVAETGVLTLQQDADAVFEILEDNFAILRHVLQDFCRQIIDSVVNGPVQPQNIPVAEWTPRSDDLDLVDRIFILRRAPPFARASLNALAELARGVVQVRFEPGMRLWRVGEPGRNVVLLVNGRVRCTPANRASFVAGGGWPLGALESIGGTTRWYEAVTETPVVGLTGDVETLYDVLEDNFDMAMGYLSTMGRAWLRSMQRIADTHPEMVKQFFGTE